MHVGFRKLISSQVEWESIELTSQGIYSTWPQWLAQCWICDHSHPIRLMFRFLLGIKMASLSFFAGTMQLLKAIVEWRRESALGEDNSEENIVKDENKKKALNDIIQLFCCCLHFPLGSDGEESSCNAGDSGLIPGSGRSPLEGNGYPHYSNGDPLSHIRLFVTPWTAWPARFLRLWNIPDMDTGVGCHFFLQTLFSSSTCRFF